MALGRRAGADADRFPDLRIMTEKRILPFQPAGIRCWIIFTDSVAAVTK